MIWSCICSGNSSSEIPVLIYTVDLSSRPLHCPTPPDKNLRWAGHNGNPYGPLLFPGKKTIPPTPQSPARSPTMADGPHRVPWSPENFPCSSQYIYVGSSMRSPLWYPVQYLPLPTHIRYPHKVSPRRLPPPHWVPPHKDLCLPQSPLP